MAADSLPAALHAGAAIWPVIVPLLGVALTALLRGRPALQRTAMECAVVLMLAASLALLARTAAGEVLTMAFGGWGAPFGVTFVVDRLGASLSVVTGIIALATAIHARADVRARRRRAGFDAIFLGMLAAVNGAFLTGDIFNLYVWFELMLVAAVGLVTIDRRPSQVDGAIRYATMSMLGATCILLGIALLYRETGTLDMAGLAARLAAREPTVALSTAACLLLAGFSLKAGVFPLFFWLPASYHTAPVAVSAAMAGLLTKVGVYACLRVAVQVLGVTSGSAVVPGLPPLLGILAAATMLVSVLGAIAQVDLRRLFAFHVMSQVGYMILGLAIATLAGTGEAIFYMLHSMLVQTGLFLAVGAIARASGSHDLRRSGGLMRAHPFLAITFAALALSLCGIPPFSGFWAKFMAIDAAFRGGATALAVVALATGLLTLHSIGRLWTQAFWQPTPRPGQRIRAVPPAMSLAIALLAACTLGIGLLVEPVSNFTRAAAAQITARGGALAAAPAAAAAAAAAAAPGAEAEP